MDYLHWTLLGTTVFFAIVAGVYFVGCRDAERANDILTESTDRWWEKSQENISEARDRASTAKARLEEFRAKACDIAVELDELLEEYQ